MTPDTDPFIDHDDPVEARIDILIFLCLVVALAAAVWLVWQITGYIADGPDQLPGYFERHPVPTREGS